jgi:hypothetical protein
MGKIAEPPAGAHDWSASTAGSGDKIGEGEGVWGIDRTNGVFGFALVVRRLTEAFGAVGRNVGQKMLHVMNASGTNEKRRQPQKFYLDALGAQPYFNVRPEQGLERDETLSLIGNTIVPMVLVDDASQVTNVIRFCARCHHRRLTSLFSTDPRDSYGGRFTLLTEDFPWRRHSTTFAGNSIGNCTIFWRC